MSTGDPAHEPTRRVLVSRLLDAIKECQLRFGGKGEIASETDSRVSVLCASLENCLRHGLKSSNKAMAALKQVTSSLAGLSGLRTGLFSDAEVEPTIWHVARENLSKTEVERFMSLELITTDIGRGRAWLRSALNEKSLGRQLLNIRDNKKLTAQLYEEWALLRDYEQSNVLCGTVSGLAAVLFSITIDSDNLNTPPPSERPDRPAPAPTSSSFSRILTNFGRSASDAILSRGEAGSTFRSTHTPAMAIPSKAGKGNVRSAKLVSFDHDSSDSDSELSPTDYSLPPESSQPNVEVTSMKSEGSLEDGEPNLLETLVPLELDGNPTPYWTESTDRTISADSQSTGSSEWAENTKADMMGRRRSTSYITRTQGDGSSLPEEMKPGNDKMSTAELKQAIVTMMMKKDEAEEQNMHLKAMLLQEEEYSKGLKVELTELQESAEERLAQEQSRVQGLTRDNGLLKHQLKKYISAVQTLRSVGPQAENLGVHIDATVIPVITPSALEQRASQEAAEYEQKLIQVAEMHGELMEFNEHLQRQLLSHEAAIRRLKTELIDLRGPLPVDLDRSLQGEGYQLTNASSPQDDPEWRPLVNIWMPGVFLKGASGSGHHVYQVFLRIRDDEWSIYRRYSELYQLYKLLKKNYPIVATFDFPPKKAVGNKGTKFVEDRKMRLQTFLRKAVQYVVTHDATLRDGFTRVQLVNLLPVLADKPIGEQIEERKKKRARTTGSTSPHTPGATSRAYTGL